MLPEERLRWRLGRGHDDFASRRKGKKRGGRTGVLRTAKVGVLMTEGGGEKGALFSLIKRRAYRLCAGETEKVRRLLEKGGGGKTGEMIVVQ